MIIIIFSVIMRVWEWVRTKPGYPPKEIEESVFDYSEEENEE